MNRVVLDASALLAVLNHERGHEKVLEHISGAMVSAVNYGEVLKKSAERGGSIVHVRTILQQLQLDVRPFDRVHAEEAARIWEACKPFGLSFADRACVSLGMLEQQQVLTAELAMTKPDLDVMVTLIRERIT